MRNVCVGLNGTDASVSWSPEKGAGTLPFSWRSIIRNHVYELLKRSSVRGAVKDKSVVLVEGAPGADDSLRVARTLCT
ncbi:hypothetical protein F443_09133, partial [Phytophthora nicotianae P1569]